MKSCQHVVACVHDVRFFTVSMRRVYHRKHAQKGSDSSQGLHAEISVDCDGNILRTQILYSAV